MLLCGDTFTIILLYLFQVLAEFMPLCDVSWTIVCPVLSWPLHCLSFDDLCPLITLKVFSHFLLLLLLEHPIANTTPIVDKGNNKITELRTILQRESQNS